MSKLILAIIIIACLFPHTLAANQPNIDDAFGPNSFFENIGSGGGYKQGVEPETIIGRIIGVSLSFVGILFLGLMVYGGYLWMTDRGNNQQLEKAKNLISAAIIGLIIVLGAYAITYFVVESIEEQTIQGSG